MKVTPKNYANEILKLLKTNIEITMYTIDDEIREKNLDFMQRYALTEEDVVEYIHLLETKHFTSRIETEDKRIKSKFLYEFIITTELENLYFEKELVEVYIKLGIKEVDHKEILVVSFHD